MTFFTPILKLAAYLMALFSVWLLWPRDLDGGLHERFSQQSVSDYSMHTLRYVSVKDGKLEIETRAEHAVLEVSDDLMNAVIVNSSLYNEKMEETKVESKEAEYNLKTRKLVMKNAVKSVSPEGFVSITQEAHYDLQTHQFNSPVPVFGESAERGFRVWGDRAESNLDEKKLFLYGNARSEFQDKKRGLTKIRGDRGVLDRLAGQADFIDHVIVEQNGMYGTGHSSKALFNKEDESIKYFSLSEDVKIKDDKGRYTRSQVAEFFSDKDSMVLTGFPSITDGNDVVTGDKITLFRNSGILEVTAANAAADKERKTKSNGKKPEISKEDEELIP